MSEIPYGGGEMPRIESVASPGKLLQAEAFRAVCSWASGIGRLRAKPSAGHASLRADKLAGGWASWQHPLSAATGRSHLLWDSRMGGQTFQSSCQWRAVASTAWMF